MPHSYSPALGTTIASTQAVPAPSPPAPSPPEFTHSDQIAGYASAVVGVTRAEKICPGYRRNPTNMAALRKWMAIQDSDKPQLSRQTIDAQKKVSSQIEALGAPSWCASILGLFGPEGTHLRGLLEAK
jgi:hypothetical protein